MHIFGVRIDNFPKEKIKKKLISFLDNHKLNHITTINPEFLLTARDDKQFRNTLNTCDLNIADGVGLHLGAWRVGETLQCRYSGVDLMWDLLKIADQRTLKVFLISDKKSLSTWQGTATAIHKTFPDLTLSGCDISSDGSNGEKAALIKTLRATNYGIVFCNFGAPAQEFFLSELKNAKIGDTRIAVGVGGAFDYITGAVTRAPKWMRGIGWEWLFRLIQEPRYRYARIWRAVFIFPWKLLFHHRENHDNRA